MECRKALLLISPHLDDSLSEAEEAALREHAAHCSACARQLALSEKIAGTMRDMGQEDIEAPKEFCAAVMCKVTAERPGREGVLSRARFSAWRRLAAIAATVMLVAGGSLGVNAGLKIAMEGKSLDYQPAPTEIVAETERQNGNGAGETGLSAPQGSGTVQGNSATGPAGSPSTDPSVASSSPNNNREAQENALKGGVDGATGPAAGSSAMETLRPTSTTARALLSSEIIINSTVIKVNAADLAAAKTIASAKAIEAGAVIQVFPEQSNGKNVMFLRITAPSDKAPKLISELENLGTMISRQDENRDITSIYNETVVQYNDLQYRISAESDIAVKSQLETQASSYKQQLDNWAMEADNFVINLWIENNL